MIPFFDEHGIPLSRVLTDRGTEYCGAPQSHEYELYLTIEDIDHSRTKARSPQTNGICERFHKTSARPSSIASLSARGSTKRSRDCRPTSITGSEGHRCEPHQGRWCYGKTPMQTFIDTLPMAKEKCIRAA